MKLNVSVLALFCCYIFIEIAYNKNMEFKIEITGKKQGDYLHVNVADKSLISEKRRRITLHISI